MSEQNIQRITQLCLLGIFGLCHLSIGHLSWTECLRLIVVLLCLLLGYYLYGEQLSRTDTVYRKTAAAFVAFLAMFSITQFDPATSSIDLRITQDRFNIIFVSTTALTLLVSVIVIPIYRDELKWSRLCSLDKVIALVLVGTLAVSVLSQEYIGRGFTIDHFPGVAKLVSYALLWFVLTRVYGRDWDVGHTSALSRFLFDKWRAPLVLIVLLFVTSAAYGGYRVTSVWRRLIASERHFSEENWSEAENDFKIVADLNRAVNIGFVRDQYLADWAVLLLKENREEEADPLLREIRAVVSDPILVERKIAEIYLRANWWKNAAAVLEDVLDRAIEKDQVVDRLGLALLKLGDTRRLVELSENQNRVPKVSVVSYDENVTMGNLHAYFSSYIDALSFYSKASELKPDDAYSEYKVGLANLKIGNHRLGLERLGRAVALDPVFADAHFYIGVGQEAMQKPAEAAMAYRRTLELLPSHQGARKALSRIDSSS